MKNKKKVLFIATVASHIKSFHIPYLKMLKENGYKTYVAANWNLSEYDKLDFCDAFIQIPIKRKPYSFDNIKAIKKLKHVIDNENFEIIHCHTPMGGVVTRIATKKSRKKYGTKVIYTAHGFHFYKGAPLKNWVLFYPVEKWLSKYTDTLITINMEDYELAKKKFKKCKDIEYVPGVGIDKNKFNFMITNKEKAKLRKELGIKEEDFVCISIGELNRNKNHLMAINAIKKINNKKIKLIIAGKGNLLDEYTKYIEDNNLSNRVKLLGYRNDIYKLLKISNCLLSCSLREGLPVNVMEALMCGLPCVVTNCRGNRDLINDGENGYVVDINAVNEMVDKILKIYNTNIDNIFLNDIYNLENIVNQMMNVYKL